MKSDKMLVVCVDANVIISGIAFGGLPMKVLERLLKRDFLHITGENVIAEVKRNLIGKLGLKQQMVGQFIGDMIEVSTVYVPSGNVRFISHSFDNLVLEVALAGRCDVLVTGDKKHLLPLKEFQGIQIEPPSKFLERLKRERK